MARSFLQQLSKEVNALAQQHDAAIAQALHEEMPRRPRPYSFSESDDFYPAGKNGLWRIIRANRQEALDAIHAPLRAGRPDEHAWLRIPSESLWVDTTIAPGKDYVETDRRLQALLSYVFGDIEMTHTHPTPTAEEAEAAGLSENYLMEVALPSGGDLSYLSIMQRACPADAGISGSIVSHYGVTTIALGKPPEDGNYFVTQGSREQHIRGNALEPVLAIREALADLAVRSHFVADTSRHPFITSFSPLPSH
jgi:hypothetical protein